MGVYFRCLCRVFAYLILFENVDKIQVFSLIFVSVGTEVRHPVIVYVHGESFEWNSGNPYDGSVLAAYADLVVVTLNYRLGILGKLKPHLSIFITFY